MKVKIIPYLILLIGLTNIFGTCAEGKEAVYPKNAVEFSQYFILAIKTDQPYSAYKDTLSRIDLDKLSMELATANQKLAFWINTYNALVQSKIRDNKNSFDNKDSFFKNQDQTIGGIKLSLDEIENGILRRKTARKNKDFIERFRVNKLDPRIHFTLNCGATSCPPIAYYSVDNLNTELSLAENSFVKQTSVYNEVKNSVEVSQLFDWFEEDFGGSQGVLSTLKRLNIIPIHADPKITYSTYNWNLDIDNY